MIRYVKRFDKQTGNYDIILQTWNEFENGCGRWEDVVKEHAKWETPEDEVRYNNAQEKKYINGDDTSRNT